VTATADSFVEYALNPNLDEAGAYTVCRLIDTVGCFIRDDWDWDWLDRRRKEFKSLIEPGLVRDAWPMLEGREWLSLQTIRDDDTKVTCLSALRYLTRLRRLVIQGNSVADLGPVCELRGLVYLNCHGNRLEDIGCLQGLTALQELLIAGNPLRSLQAIANLPSLCELHLGVSQVSLLTGCPPLRKLLALYISPESFEDDEGFRDLTGFPEMPELQRLDATGVGELKGIERYPSLQDLELRSGTFESLEPLRGLRYLTHLNISSSRPLDFTPLHQLFALRYLHAHGATASNVSQLAGLPALHDLSVTRDDGEEDSAAKKLARTLTSWDVEFRTDGEDKTPSLEVEVVDQATFDYLDQNPYGIQPGDANLSMLCSERGWLMDKIESALTVTLEAGDEGDSDLALPGVGGMRRSERVIAYSRLAYQAFRDIVITVQTNLCECRNPWIVWFQSLLKEGPDAEDLPDDTEDFIVWIHPDKIQVAEKHASVVKRLLEW
jgi:hypothetical protein